MQRLAIACLMGMLASIGAMPSIANAALCSAVEARTGICPNVSTTGGSVDVSASDASAGDEGESGGEGANDSVPSPGTSSPSPDGSGLGGNPRRIIDDLDPCPECAVEQGPAAPLTLQDLASFAPSAPAIRMEPDGWMLRGLPANFIADATEQTVGGSLLGRPIDVRFAPASYTWTWGDGHADTFSQSGRTWSDLGLPRFSETATSHTYTERGTVTVGLSVAHSVAYRLGDGEWVTVDGTVAATVDLDAYVGTARTVLVPADCVADPSADGC